MKSTSTGKELVFRIRRGPRAFYFLAGLLVIWATAMGAMEVWRDTRSHGGVLVFFGMLATGMLVLGLSGIHRAWLYKVTINENLLTHYSFGKKRSIRRNEVSHARLEHHYRGESMLVIYPLDPKARPVRISADIERLKFLSAWLNTRRSRFLARPDES